MASAALGMMSRICVFFTLSLLFVHLPSTCLAQDNDGYSSDSPAPSSGVVNQPSSTSSAAAQTHTISVGLADHKFKPESTNASIGDTIEFAFYPLNHSVVRAEYGYPCIPYEMTGQGKAGFFSGFKPVDSVLTFPPTYSIQIKNTDPIFFYCSAVGSCIGYGMVGVINPNITTSVDRQHQLALDSTYMLNPGEPFPPESPLPSNPSNTSSTPNDGAMGEHLSAGAIAGIAITCASTVVIAALLIFFWGRTKRLKKESDQKAGISGMLRLGPNNRSPLAMLDTGHRCPTTTTGAGAGDMYQQYQQRPLLSPPVVDPAYQQYDYNQGYSTPAPSYFLPQTPPPPAHPPPPPPLPPPSSQQQMQQQQQYKYEVNSPTGHPVHTLPPIQQQPPLNIHHVFPHHSLGGAFELSPTSDYTRNAQTHQATPTSNSVNDPDIISPSPSHHHRCASSSSSSPPPHALATAATSATATTTTTTNTTTTTAAEELIPSYFETVYRPDPKHVNGVGVGPVEMDGRAVEGNIAPVRTVVARWEEVGEKTVDEGGA